MDLRFMLVVAVCSNMIAVLKYTRGFRAVGISKDRSTTSY
jgi:hypothetical protein